MENVFKEIESLRVYCDLTYNTYMVNRLDYLKSELTKELRVICTTLTPEK